MTATKVGKWVLGVKVDGHITDNEDLYHVFTFCPHPLELNAIPGLRADARASDHSGYTQIIEYNVREWELQKWEKENSWVWSTLQDEGREALFRDLLDVSEERKEKLIFDYCVDQVNWLASQAPEMLRPGWSFFAQESARAKILWCLCQAYEEEARDYAKAVEAGC